MNPNKLVFPNEWDIEFRILSLPEGGYGVTCTECYDRGAKQHTWRFPHFATVLRFQAEHRKLHFGI